MKINYYITSTNHHESKKTSINHSLLPQSQRFEMEQYQMASRKHPRNTFVSDFYSTYFPSFYRLKQIYFYKKLRFVMKNIEKHGSSFCNCIRRKLILLITCHYGFFCFLIINFLDKYALTQISTLVVILWFEQKSTISGDLWDGVVCLEIEQHIKYELHYYSLQLRLMIDTQNVAVRLMYTELQCLANKYCSS